MTDALLSSADQMEALSLVYARAVAARAGYVTSVRDLDRDGVDLHIQAGGAMRPAIDLQMKATGNLGEPKDEEMWMTLTRNELILRRRAYWLNLRGCEETTNQTSITVHLPITNLFNVGGLQELMEQSRKGRIE